MRRSVRPGFEMLEGKALLSGATMTAAGLAETLTASPSRSAGGMQIVLTFTETNDTDHDVNVADGPSIDGFVATQGGRAVWASNSGIQPDFIALETLKPGQSFILKTTWDGRSDSTTTGAPLKGTFVIHNALAPAGPTATVTLGATTPARSPHRAR